MLKTDDNDNDCHVIRGQQKCPLYMCEVGLDVSLLKVPLAAAISPFWEPTLTLPTHENVNF